MADDLVERLVAEWLDEQEGFASRRERMTEEISTRPEAWLEAACRVGIPALQAQNRKLVEALRPFAAFAEAGSFDKLADDLAMTQGSRFAHRQVTAGDFKRARAAIAEAEKGEG